MIGCDDTTITSSDLNGTEGIKLDRNTSSISNMVNVSDINITDNAILVICTEGSTCSVSTQETNTADNNSTTD